MATKTLTEDNRLQLDTIVKRMVENRESDQNIRMVVDDFKTRFGKSISETAGERIGEQLQKRGKTVVESFKKTARGERAPLLTSLVTVGQGAGLVGDVLGEAITGIGKMLLPSYLKRDLTLLAQTAFQSKDVQTTIAAYKAFKQKYPESAAGLEAAANILSLIPIGKGGQIAGKAAIQTGKATTRIAPVVAQKAVATTGAVGRFGTAQLTGLAPSTVSQIIKTPAAFSALERSILTRSTLGEKVKRAIEGRLTALSGLGKEYEVIRKAGEKVVIPENAVRGVLQKYGLDYDGAALKMTAESVPLKSGDRAALEGFLNQYGQVNTLSGNAFLNTRKALSNLASFGVEKTDIADRIARDLREIYDTAGKKQLKGLAELDARYSPEVNLLQQVKRDYLKPDGTLKDAALSKLANLTGKGREQILKRLERVVPGIERDVNIVRALEDVEYAAGQKVGAYARGATGGFILSGGSPSAAFITAILSSPTVAVPIIRAYGATKGIFKNILDGIIKKLNSGNKLGKEEAGIVSRAFQAESNLRPKGNPLVGLIEDDISLKSVYPKNTRNIKKILGGGGFPPSGSTQ